jgi:hypothetical protein
MADDPPNELCCPITLDVMTDPVIMPDGQTYERAAITRALQVNGNSPITRQPMSISDAKPNYALRAIIERWRQGGAS